MTDRLYRRSAVKTRKNKVQERKENALGAMPIKKLVQHLGLVRDNLTICPICQQSNTLRLNDKSQSFSCTSCKKKGNSINLVQKARDLTYWKAIGYLEDLAVPTPATAVTSPQAETKTPTQPQQPKAKPEAIPQAEIERIKQRHRLEDVIAAETGVQFQRKNQNLICCCPFPDHDDTTPSFSVLPHNQSFHCFGCGKKGDVIEFLRLYKNYSFREVLGYLEPATEISSIPQPQTLPEPKLNPVEQQQWIQRCRDFFHKRLLQSPQAQEFLKQRGLFDKTLVEHFQLGFDDGKINQNLNSESLADLRELGLINGNDKVRFYRCITVGLEDPEGHVISLYGRRIDPDKGAKHQFPQGHRPALFNSRVFKASQEIILTEGVLDALSLWSLGYKNVSCLFSASVIPEILIEQLTRYSIKTVYLALDSDAAGQLACQRLAEKLRHFDIELRRICFPDNIKDANELLVRHGKDQALTIFRQLLETAQKFSLSPAKPNTDTPLQLEWQDKRGTAEGILQYEIELIAREHGALRIVLTAKRDNYFHTDKLDLYRSQARFAFAMTASKRFEVPQQRIEHELEQILVALRHVKSHSKNSDQATAAPVIHYSAEEKQQALAWLKNPNFFEEIPQDYEALGYVGESAAKKISYLCAVSRKLDKPLPCIFRASSAGGKTSLMDATAKLCPTEDVLYISELSKQALYYMSTERIQHKLIIVDERKGSEEANYAIRTLLSRGVLKKAIPVKDSNGEMQTMIRELQGPIGFMESTTEVTIDPENENRCLIVFLDDSQQQTKLIHEAQREFYTAAGRQKMREANAVMRRNHLAQTLLKPCKVDIPFAHRLKFPSHWCRTRRDNQKFLQLLATIAYLHQYQRQQYQENGETVVIAEHRDYEIAYHLAPSILRPAVSDLSDKHYELLEGIDSYINEQAKKREIDKQDIIFTRSELSRYIGWQLHQIKSYLPQLVELEYIIQIGSHNKGATFRYTRNYNVPDPSNPLTWLVSPQDLDKTPAVKQMEAT